MRCEPKWKNFQLDQRGAEASSRLAEGPMQEAEQAACVTTMRARPFHVSNMASHYLVPHQQGEDRNGASLVWLDAHFTLVSSGPLHLESNKKTEQGDRQKQGKESVFLSAKSLI